MIQIGDAQVEELAVGEHPGIDSVETALYVYISSEQPGAEGVGEHLGAGRVGGGADHDDQAVEVGELALVVVVIAAVAAAPGDEVVLAGAKFEAGLCVEDRRDRERDA